MNNAGEKFYYCPNCKKFHEYGSSEHNPVNRKLCFYCDKVQIKKTKIIGDNVEGRSQICDKCYKEIFEY